MTRLRRVLACERGYTLIELVQATAILTAIVAGLTVVFVRATNAELQMNERFRAQQSARVAVDKMRREIHCASLITPTGPASSIAVTLPSQCPTSGGSLATIVYDLQAVSTNRWRLRRAGVTIADYVTTNTGVFNYTAPQVGKLGTLHLLLPIDVDRTNQHVWRLEADIVLRNTLRL
jgi:Tfp pilus assembly protein PilW